MFQEQAPEYCAALAIDDAIDIFRPETTLEGNHSLGAIGYAIAITFECQQEGGIAPPWIDKIFGRPRNSKPYFRKALPIKQFTRIFLARGCHIAVADNIAGWNSIGSHNFSD